MKTVLRVILTVALVGATVITTAHLTYRETMRQMQIETKGSTVYLTAWGQTDVYTLD